MVITPEGDAFRITANLQVCVEAHGSCLFDTTVLDNVLLKPEFCKYGTGFVTSGKTENPFEVSHGNENQVDCCKY